MRDVGIDEIYGRETIRHTTITYWRSLGLDIQRVMDCTLHHSEQLVQRFYDLSKTKVDIMADILNGFKLGSCECCLNTKMNKMREPLQQHLPQQHHSFAMYQKTRGLLQSHRSPEEHPSVIPWQQNH